MYSSWLLCRGREGGQSGIAPTVQATGIDPILLFYSAVDLEPDAVRRSGVNRPPIRQRLDEEQAPSARFLRGRTKDLPEVEPWSSIDDRYANRPSFYLEVDLDRGLVADLRVPDGVRHEFTRGQLGFREFSRLEDAAEPVPHSLPRFGDRSPKRSECVLWREVLHSIGGTHGRPPASVVCRKRRKNVRTLSVADGERWLRWSEAEADRRGGRQHPDDSGCRSRPSTAEYRGCATETWA